MVGAIDVRDGDTLIIAFSGRLTDAQFDDLQERIRPWLPKGVRIGMIDGVASMVRYRPDMNKPCSADPTAGADQ